MKPSKSEQQLTVTGSHMSIHTSDKKNIKNGLLNTVLKNRKGCNIKNTSALTAVMQKIKGPCNHKNFFAICSSAEDFQMRVMIKKVSKKFCTFELKLSRRGCEMTLNGKERRYLENL